jgi:putative ABC transport system permease protein
LNIISELDKTIKRIYPEKITEYQVLSQSLEQQYQNEIKVGKIFNLFCILTLVLTMLGLFGQSVFSMQTRTKEIGIRKVNGASIYRIIKMFLMEFVMLLIIAFLIAAPLAIYLMNKWLQNFAYKIRFDSLILLEAGLLVLILILLTVIWQTYQQASQNVTDVLRSE